MTARRQVSLLEIEPDLGALVAEEKLASAREELLVEVHHLPCGPWSIAATAATNPAHVGLLLIDGVIARDVVIADTVSSELIGPGDVVRPWAMEGSPTLLQVAIRWVALTECRVAILDRRFAAILGHWPEVNAVLIDRLVAHARRLAITRAICQLNGVDRRLLAMFWHLADRWGRVGSEGVIVPLALSHRMLGQLVGARRPTVSSVISELAERDELIRRYDGTWLLKGEPVGVSAGEADRVIPVRRPAVGRPTLHDTLARLCRESAVRIELLQGNLLEAERLHQYSLSACRERAKRETPS